MANDPRISKLTSREQHAHMMSRHGVEEKILHEGTAREGGGGRNGDCNGKAARMASSSTGYSCGGGIRWRCGV